LQAPLPHLTPSNRHRCPQRHGINRLPEMASDHPAKQTFKPSALGDPQLDLAAVHTAEGKLYLVVTIDRPSTCTDTELYAAANTMGGA
jgi:hypothetical protein